MKKFIINILVFFGIVAVLDMAVGKAFWYLQSTKAGGRTGAEYYANKESSEDVIIMGSSRAQHHYVPQIISDSLGLTCINAGQSGNGIVLQYGRWKLISMRYAPKLIIYDVTYYYDLMKNDNMAYVDRLKPFCNNSVIYEYVSELFPLEQVKLFAQMYRYNYKFLEILSDSRMSAVDNDGYEPLFGKIKDKRVLIGKVSSQIGGVEYDELKMSLFEKFVGECRKKGTKLIFVVSPTFNDYNNNSDIYEPIIDVAKRNNIPCFLYNNTTFTYDEELFKDTQHLNNDGAMAFTKELTGRIKELISNEPSNP